MSWIVGGHDGYPLRFRHFSSVTVGSCRVKVSAKSDITSNRNCTAVSVRTAHRFDSLPWTQNLGSELRFRTRF